VLLQPRLGRLQCPEKPPSLVLACRHPAPFLPRSWRSVTRWGCHRAPGHVPPRRFCGFAPCFPQLSDILERG
jgi:hypothetical protein